MSRPFSNEGCIRLYAAKIVTDASITIKGLDLPARNLVFHKLTIGHNYHFNSDIGCYLRAEAEIIVAFELIAAVEGVEHPGVFLGDVRVAEVLTHFHHQLIARGMSVKKTVLISYSPVIGFMLLRAAIVFMRTRYAVAIYLVVFGSCCRGIQDGNGPRAPAAPVSPEDV